MDHLKQKFIQKLTDKGISANSLKFYRSDLNHFQNWLIAIAGKLGAEPKTLNDVLPFVNRNTASEYKKFLLKEKISEKTINRRLTTLRHLGHFLAEQDIINYDFTEGLTNISFAKAVSPFATYIKQFQLSLESTGKSRATVKSYVSDITQLLKWAHDKGEKKLQDITSKDFKRYLILSFPEATEATVSRKTSSLNHFFNWAKKQNYVSVNPLDQYLADTRNLKPIRSSLTELTTRRLERPVFGQKPAREAIYQKLNAYFAENPKVQKLIYNLLYNRPQWYKTYHSLAITRYFHLALLMVFATGIGFGIYQQFFAKAPTPVAYPATPTRPNRYLSFQGRLTNEVNTPVTTATDLVFKLYDAATDGNTLWNSGTCSITPDQDGIFSTLLGSNCGSEIAATVFSENADVWLGITVGADAEATPRIQIATVAYALNAETLQGYPIDATGSAVVSSVVTMDAGGQVVLAELGPKIKSVAGTFAIEGQAITLQTASGTNGDIALAPDGTGSVNITSSAQSDDALYITNAQTTSGAVIHGYYSGASSNINLLRLGSGASESTVFTVDSEGDTTLASGADLYIGAIGLNDNASGSSGASLIGLYDDSMAYIAANTTVQGAIKELDTAIGTVSGSAGGWTDDGDIVRLTTAANRVGIGTTSVHASTKLGITGGVAIGTQGTYADVQAPSNGLVVEGNVGIGTTAPVSLLDITSTTGGLATLRREDISVTSNDMVGKIQFYAKDTSTTTNFVVADIEAQATNTISTDINPGRLIFRTTPTTVAATPIERMRITEGGFVGIGTSSPSYTLDVADNNITSTYASQIASTSVTSGRLLNLRQTTSTFSGTGLYMDFANASGSFTGNYLDLRNNTSSRLAINYRGGITGSYTTAATGETATLHSLTYTNPSQNATTYYNLSLSSPTSTITSATTGSTDEPLDNAYEAFRFNTGSYNRINAVRIRLKKLSTALRNGYITAYLYADDGGSPPVPTGAALATGGTIYSSNMTTSFANHDVTLAYNAATSTNYWVVFRYFNLSAGDVVFASTTGTEEWAYSANGSSWTNQNGTKGYYYIYTSSSAGLYASSYSGSAIVASSTLTTPITTTTTRGSGISATSTYGYAGAFTGAYGLSITTTGIGLNGTLDYYGINNATQTQRGGYRYYDAGTNNWFSGSNLYLTAGVANYTTKFAYYDGASFTNVTTNARYPGGTAYTLLADTNDYFYFGRTSTTSSYRELFIDIANSPNLSGVTWEYASGEDGGGDCNAWTPFTPTLDETNGLIRDGVVDFTSVSFSVQCKVDSTDAYWMRVSATSVTTGPTAYASNYGMFDGYFARWYGTGIEKFQVDYTGALKTAGYIYPGSKGTDNEAAVQSSRYIYDLTTMLGTNSSWYVAGNVGIGTTTPGAKLVVMNGNVGIGTTSPTANFNLIGNAVISPTDPVYKASVADSTNNDNPFSVVVQGKYAYLTGQNSDTLSIFDVSTPTSTPVRLGTAGGVGNTYFDGAAALAVNGRYAYVGTTVSDRITVVDVSDPTTPTVVGSIQSTTQLDFIMSIAISGKYLYAASRDDDLITVVDISNPALPTIISSTTSDSTDVNDPYAIYIRDKYLYAAVRMDSGGATTGARLTIFDISNPTQITKINSITSANLNDARDVYVVGKYAYVTGYVSNSVVVFNISNTASLSEAGYLTDATNLSGAHDIKVAGNYAYVTTAVGNRYTILDISSPTPVYSKSYTSASYVDGIRDAVVIGRYAYLAASDDDMLTILDVGSEINSVYAGALTTGQLTVDNEAAFAKEVLVGGGLNVSGNLLANNGLAAFYKSTVTSAGTESGINLTLTDTGNISSGTDTTYGVYSSVTRTGATDGTFNTYGGYFSATGDTAGTATAVGLYATASGADSNYAAIFDAGNVGIGVTNPSSSLSVGSSGVNRFNVVGSSGYLGIGTTSPQYAIDVVGDIYSNANIRAATDLYIAGTALSANSTSTSGSSKVGLYDDAMTYIATNTTVQGAIKELDTAIGTVSGSAGGWTDDGDIVRLTTAANRVGIGTTSVHASTKLGITGGVAIGTQGTYADVQAPSNGLIVEGNVGIGTTSPQTKLGVVGGVGIGTTASFANAAIAANNLAVQGSVGIGVTSPISPLHVEGQCVTGDTLLPIVEKGSEKDTFEKGSTLKDPDSEKVEPYQTSQVQIKNIKGGEYVLSLDEATGKIVPARIKGLLDMGVKPVYKLTTEDGREIRTTGNHPYLTKDGWKKVIYLEEGQEIAITSAFLGGNGNKYRQKNNSDYQESVGNINTGEKILGTHNDFPFSVNTRETNNPTIPNQILAVNNAKYSPDEETPNIPGETSNTPNHAAVRLTNKSDITSRKVLYENSLISNSVDKDQFNVKWAKIASIEFTGYEQVYDIEVEGTHNFVANGIIAHNTYINGDVGISTTSPLSALDVRSGNVGIGTTMAAAYKLDVAGDIRIGAGSDLYIGAIGLNDNASGSSGASLIGLYDDSMAYIAANTTVQGAIKELDTAIGTVSGSAGGWTDDGDIVRLTTAANRVGIGTTSVHASTKLGITGGVAIGTQGTYADVQAPSNGLIVEGNVGIGTTGPGTKLQVVDTGTASPRGISSLQISSNLVGALISIQKARGTVGTPTTVVNGDYLGGLLAYGYDGSSYVGPASVFFKTNGTIGSGSVPTDLIFSTGSSGTGGGTEAMRITSAGNVGIGTTSPGSLLHASLGAFGGVSGTGFSSSGNVLQIEDNDHVGIELNSPSTKYGSIYFRDESNTANTTEGYIRYQHTDNTMRFAVDGNLDMLTLKSGSVGIGTTGPGRRLSVVGDTGITHVPAIGVYDGSTLVIDLQASNTVYGPLIQFPTGSGGFDMFNYRFFGADGTYGYKWTTKGSGGSSVDRLSISGNVDTANVSIINSNVGIGTTVPTKGKLNVLGSVAIGSTAYTEPSGAAPSNGLIVEGNVGIGTTGPRERLDVANGNIRLDAGTYGIRWDSTANRNEINFDSASGLGVYAQGNMIFTFDSDNSQTDRVFGINSNSTGGRLVTILESGNVGIGTTSPGTKLGIVGGVGIGTTASFANAAIAANNLAVQGSVGIGVTAPSVQLHVAGQCVTGDTLLRRRRRKKGKKQKAKLTGTGPDPKDTSDGGRMDSSEVDDIWEWEEVRIDEIEPGDEIQTLDETRGEIVIAKVKKLMNMGIKQTFLLITATGKNIRTTREHPYLVRPQASEAQIIGGTFEIDQGNRIENLDKLSSVAIADPVHCFAAVLNKTVKRQTKRLFQKAHRTKFFGAATFANLIVLLLKKNNLKPTKLIIDKEYSGYDDIIVNILRQYDRDIIIEFKSIGKSSPAHQAAYSLVAKKTNKKATVASVIKVETAAELHPEFTGISLPAHGQLGSSYQKPKQLSSNNARWLKTFEIKPGMEVATATSGKRPSLCWEKIVAVKPFGEEMVWDIEIPGTHNFVGNGIVAHNTYINSSSANALLVEQDGVYDNILSVDGSTGRVGIGTTSPQTKLGIVGGVGIGTTDSFANAAIAANNLAVQGSVGIGITNPSVVLDVVGDVKTSTDFHIGTVGLTDTASPTTSGGYLIGVNDEFDNSANTNVQAVLNDLDAAISGGGSGSMWTLASGVIYPTSATNDFAIGGTTLASPFSVDENTNTVRIGEGSNSNAVLNMYASDGDTGSLTYYTSDAWAFEGGNVGIGTTGPIGRLHVYNGASGQGTANTSLDELVIENNANAGISILTPNTNIARYGFGDPEDSFIAGLEYDNSSDLLTLQANNIDALAINSSGNVGIGTTSPRGKFDVFVGSSGSITPSTSGDDLILESGTTVGMSILTADSMSSFLMFGSPSDSYGSGMYWNHDTDLFTIGTANTGAAIQFQTANQANAVRIDSSGRVGIGTTSPQTKLGIVGGVGIGTTDSFANAAIAANNLAVQGSVGIGITNPSVVLDVVGDVKTSTDFHIGTIGLTDTASPTTSGGYLIGVNDEFDNSANTNVQAVLNDLDAAISGGGSGSMWTLASGVIYPTSATNDFAIGGTTLASPFSVDEGSNTVRIGEGANSNAVLNMYASDGDTGSLTYYTSDAWSFEGGNVGIGTTGPGTTLHVSQGSGTPTSAAGFALAEIGVTDDSLGRIYIQGSGQTDLILDDTSAPANQRVLHIVTDNGISKIQSVNDTFSAFPEEFFSFDHSNGNTVTGTTGGNVGIGTTFPAAKLSVLGGVGIGTTLTDGFAKAAIAANNLAVQGSVGIGTTAPLGSLDIRTGNVGIGTTMAPTQLLDVMGAMRLDGQYYDENNSVGTPGQVLSTTATGTDWIDAATDTDDQTLAEVLAQGNTTGGNNIVMSTTDEIRFYDDDNDSRIYSPSDGTITIASATLDLDGSTAFDLDAGAVTIDATGAISLDAAAASNFTTSAGDLTLEASAASVNINANEAAVNQIYLNAQGTIAGNAIVATTTNGGIALDANGANGTITLDTSTNNTQISLTSGSGEIDLTTTGTMDLNAAAFDVDASGALTLTGSTNSAIDFPAFDVATSGDVTLTKTDPSIIFAAGGASDTDFWLGVNDDNGNDDDDRFQIGDGATPGSNIFVSIDTSGNVGIGTTFPAAKLSVLGGVGIGTTLTDGFAKAAIAANNLAVQGSVGIGTTAPLGSLDVRTGNVGIGTTMAPTQLLDVMGNMRLDGQYYDENNSVGTPGQVLSTTATGTDWIDAATGTVTGTGTDNYLPRWNGTTALEDSIIYDDNTNIGIGTTVPTKGKLNVLGSVAIGSTAYTEPSGAAPSNGLIVEGKVGFGVTSPNYKLDVADTNSSADLNLFRIDSSINGETIGTIYFSGSDSADRIGAKIVAAGSGDWGTNTNDAGVDLEFYTQSNSDTDNLGTPRLTLENNGNIGFGIASPTEFAEFYATGINTYLQVESGDNAAGFKILSDSTGEIALYSGNNQDDFRISINSSDKILLNSSGNLGIGTTFPATKLSVLGGVGIGTTLTDGFAKAAIAANNLAVQGSVGIGTTAPLGSLDVRTGNVGIGTTMAPTQLLDVMGNMRLDGQYYDENNSVGTPGQVLSTTATGTDWIDAATGTVTGTGTDNYLPRWNGTTALEDSIIYDDNTNIGIGTTVPTKGKLNVLGSVAIGSTAYTEPSGAAPSNGLIVEGNVGIGTTGPDSLMQIVGSTAGDGGSFNGSGSILHLKQNTGWTGNQPWALFVEGYSYLNGFRINAADGIRALYKTASGGQLGFAVAGNDPITFTQSVNTERMRIAAGGNVGIGTTFPATKLSVLGGVGIGTTLTDGFAKAAIAANNLAVQGSVGIGTTAPLGSLDVRTGNVGIGTTMAPTQLLDVMGNMRLDGQYYDENNSVGTPGQVLSTTATGTDWIDAATDTDDQTLAEVLAQGNTTGGNNIVMSTTDEIRFYDDDNDSRIYGISDGVIAFNSTSLDFDSATLDFTTQSTNFDLKNTTVNALSFESNLLSFDTNSSRIGIGTTSPQALTHVGSAGTPGSIDGTDDLYVYDDLEVDGTIYGTISGYSSGTGTAGYLPYWDTSTSFANSGAYYSGSNIGIGTTVPTKGKLNVLGSVAIGSTAYTEPSGAAPSNGLIVEGNVGIGTTSPGDALDVVGEIDASTYYKLNNIKFLDDINSGVLVGHYAGNSTSGGNNVFVGYQAGYTNTTGIDNVAIGTGALYSNVGNTDNVAVGTSALSYSDGGYYNTALGNEAGLYIETGAYNVALGVNALDGNYTSGSFNIGLGWYTLDDLTSGSENIAIGSLALAEVTSSNNNIGIGYYTGENLQTGGDNIFIGYYAGRGSNRTGSDNNIAIGREAGYSLGTDDDGNVFLGYQAGYSETGSNKLYIENSNALPTAALIYGDFSTNTLTFNANVGIGTTSPQTKLGVVGGVGIGTTDSFANAAIAANNLAVQGSVGIGTTSPGMALQVGTGSETHTLSTGDVLITSDLEVDGIIYADGLQIANADGNTTIKLATDPDGGSYPDDYNTLSNGSWLVDNTINPGLAALVVDQSKAGDIFTASASGTPKFTIKNDGKIGIGTTSPGYWLHVAQNANTLLRLEHTGDTSPTQGAGMFLYAANNGSALLNADRLGFISFTGYDGATNQNAALIQTVARGNWSSGNFPTDLVFETTASTSRSEKVRITGGGYVGIGTTLPQTALGIVGGVGIGTTNSFANAAIAANNLAVQGSVGIGITNPSVVLDVVGDVKTSTDFHIGTVGLTDTASPTTSGAYLIGVNDEFDNSANTNVQAVLNDLDTAISGGGSGSMWTLASGVIYPTSATNDFAIGGTTLASPFSVDEGSNTVRIGEGSNSNAVLNMYASDGDTGSLTYYTSDAWAFEGGNVGIGVTNPASKFVVAPPDTETITSGATVTADACGTMKRISSAGTVTTDTTNTFTAPTAQYAGCFMIVTNVGSNQINLDRNTNFKTDQGAASVQLLAGYSIIVSSDGTYWYQVARISQAADIAEYYFYDGEKPQPGDIVSTTPNKISITRTSLPNDAKAVGIISTNPAMTLGEYSSSAIPVALNGRVPTKVMIKNGQILNGDPITSSSTPGVGIKATKPGQIVGKALESTQNWNDQACPAVPSIDDIVWPEDDGTNQNKPCFTLPGGLIVGKIMVFVNLSWSDPDVYLTDTGDFDLVKIGLSQSESANSPSDFNRFQLISTDSNRIVNRIGVFSEAAVANLRAGAIVAKDGFIEGGFKVADTIIAGAIETSQISADRLIGDRLIAKVAEITETLKAGIIETQNITTDGFLAFRGTVDNLLVKVGLVSPTIRTAMISPLQDEKDINIILGKGQEVNGESEPGKLSIKNADGTEVASIDSTGKVTAERVEAKEVNAQKVTGDELSVNRLYAEEIIGKDGLLLSNQNNSDTVTLEQIEELIRQAEADQVLLTESQNWNTDPATNSAEPAAFYQLHAADLYVTNQAAMNTLSLSSSLSVGTDMVISSTLDQLGHPITSINSLSAPLQIQSLALAPVEIMAGMFKIDTNGDVTITGNLHVAGRIDSQGLTLSESENRDPITDTPITENRNLLTLKDTEGNEVSSVDSAGTAKFREVATGKLIIADATDETLAVNSLGEIDTNATAGTATLKAKRSGIIINHPGVTDKTLIYVTPTSSTKNSVLFVKSKEPGKFTVGFIDPINIDVTFNWWIIDVSQ